MKLDEKIDRKSNVQRRLPIGAEILPDGGVSFRIWAPKRKTVSVVFEQSKLPEVQLKPEGGGYFSGTSAEARAGALYRLRLDKDTTLYPDPVSRFQPEGPHGPSQVIDADSFQWTDQNWPGIGPA